MPDSEQKDNFIEKIPLRIFKRKGKEPVAEEQNIDDVITEQYDPEVENSRTKNRIKLSQNFVWGIIGTGSFLLISLNLIFSYYNLLYLSRQLTNNNDDKVFTRLEKLY